MDYLSTYHLCPWTQVTSQVYVGKPTQLVLKSPEPETTSTKYLTVLTFLLNLSKLTVKGLSVLKVQLEMVI